MPPTLTQLTLLADHLSLQLQDRKRKNPTPQSDKELKRNLDSLRNGLDQVESQTPPQDVSVLRAQYTTLQADYNAAISPPAAAAATASTRDNSTARPDMPRTKSVRFTDNPDDEVDESARAALFNRYSDSNGNTTTGLGSAPYTDDPSGTQEGYSDVPPEPEVDNQQLYDQHSRTMAEQDTHLDNLGASVRQQRMLGISIGNELDEQNGMLSDVERGVDRFQSTLDRGRERLGKFARQNKGGISWMIIAILVLVLIILVAI